MADVIDLDALIPEPRQIKLGDETLEVQPPTTLDLIKLGSLSRAMGDVDGFSDEELAKAIADLTSQIYKCIPPLEGKRLNLAQLQTLVDILNDMGTPPEVKALAEQGVEAVSPKAAA